MMNMLNTKFKFLSIAISIILIPSLLSASMIFEDVPKNHWAYDAVAELADRGIIEGFEGKASRNYKGDKALTRYEFAQALLKAIQKIEAEIGVTKATGAIDEVDVNQVLSKSNLDNHDIQLLKRLIEEFKKELADMNLRVTDLEAKQRNMELSQPNNDVPLYISIGSAIVSIIALIISISK